MQRMGLYKQGLAPIRWKYHGTKNPSQLRRFIAGLSPPDEETIVKLAGDGYNRELHYKSITAIKAEKAAEMDALGTLFIMDCD